METPAYVKEAGDAVINNLLPVKSTIRYWKAYKDFRNVITMV